MNLGSYTYALLVAFPSLTAGIFEESARYIAYKYIVKDHSFGNGLTLGSGHGGIDTGLNNMYHECFYNYFPRIVWFM